MLNVVTIQGRITHTPEVRQTQSGVSVLSFSIACERDFADKATDRREVDFINCQAWRSTADFIAKYFPKGAMILLVGRLQVRSYEGRDGTKKTATEVVVSNAYFCGEKRERTQDGGDTYNNNRSYTTQETPRAYEPEDEGELPF